MGLKPLVLLTPSMASAVELPRRLASTGRALAGLYPFKVLDLARAIAEPELLGRGLKAWDTGHDALLAARLLEEAGARALAIPPELPRAPIAVALARTLSSLRLAGLPPERLAETASRADITDGERLGAVAALYRRFHEEVEGRFADPATLLRAARNYLREARWLEGAEVLIVEDLELDPLEKDFLEALAQAFPVRLLARERPASLVPTSFRAWAESHGMTTAGGAQTVLAPLTPPAAPEGLRRLRTSLFEPPSGVSVEDGSVELVTAPGEAAEVQGIVRRLLREAGRGIPFEEMGVILPRPQEYAPLFTDLLERLEVPYRLHPSLPLRFGRSARALLLLLRCRGLPRTAVMEFLTFAPVPFERILGGETTPRPAQWDAISRDARIVSGRDRWDIGLTAYAEAERQAAANEEDPDRRERRLRRAADAQALLTVVDRLGATLEGLSGEATWPEWSDRLRAVYDEWIGKGRDREAVSDVIAELAGLTFVHVGADGKRVPWREVQAVLEARFEWERLPLEPIATGAVHVGALDAIAGLPFRVVAIPGLVEGGYPGVLRPDPFLLDAEREALAAGSGQSLATDAGAKASPPRTRRKKPQGQLSLFDSFISGGNDLAAPPEPPSRSHGSESRARCETRAASPSSATSKPFLPSVPHLLPTTQDRLLEARRLFHRAVGQATERLILSYPRADARTGRERMPSLFFVAAASALQGRPLAAPELERLVVEDDLDSLPLDDTLDVSERDRVRVRTGGRAAAERIAAGSLFFKQSRLSSHARWSPEFTAYDGLVAFSPRDGVSAQVAMEVKRRLDPVTLEWPISASRLATFSRCGFMYMLQHVLRLDPALEPEERKRLEPLERGDLFHRVAERFLRERRDRGELPVRNTPPMRARLVQIADECLDSLVAGSPPRFRPLWEREKSRFRESLLTWLARESDAGERSTPAYFEVSFGPTPERAPGEPHSPEPLAIDLGDGRTLRVSGKIDRIDRRSDGSLVLRDYKTGKAPRDEGGIFRGGRQLQIPFYILAAARLFPDQPVLEAFLDFVDGGRRVALDPASVKGEEFRSLLRGLVDAIAQGHFVQEPTACDWCDYTVVCGPKPLLDLRRRYKLGDPRVQRVLRLREVG